MIKPKEAKMAIFNYSALTKDFKKKKGVIEAANKQVALETLKSKELIPLSLQLKSESLTWSLKNFSFYRKKVKYKEKVIFTRQLSTMLNAGLSIIDCLENLSEQSNNLYLKEIIDDMISKVRAGEKFSDALLMYPNVFDKLYVNLVASGEASGKLDEILLRLADQMEKDYNLRSAIKSALYYPGFILISIISVAGVILIYVLPQLETIFRQSKVKLPWVTQFLLWLSSNIKSLWWIFLLALLAIVLGLRYFSKSENLRKHFDSLKLKIPLIRELYKKIYLGRFTRSLGNLLNSGLSILEALSISASVIGNSLLESKIKGDISLKVESGIPLSEALAGDSNFPRILVQMVAAGERAGNVDEMLSKLADFYDNEVSTFVKTLSSLLEPVLVVLLGVAAAILVYSIMIPIYDLAQIRPQ